MMLWDLFEDLGACGLAMHTKHNMPPRKERPHADFEADLQPPEYAGMKQQAQGKGDAV